MARLSGVDAYVGRLLYAQIVEIEKSWSRDCIVIYGPLLSGVDQMVREVVEDIPNRNAAKQLVVLVNTDGGVVEVVERIVDTLRHFYDDVAFVIPDRAMSAGTVLVMSGDSIFMDYFSRLGPIDPQLEKEDGQTVPVVGYLIQYQRLLDKSESGMLNDAELALLDRFDLAELLRFEEAKELSIDLLKKWLKKYKFKDWGETETSKKPVTKQMKLDRAEAIATMLNDPQIWHSHGRAISRDVLMERVGLRIDRLEADPVRAESVALYHGLLADYMLKSRLIAFAQSRALTRHA